MFKEAETRQDPEYTFTVSARSKKPEVPIFLFLRRQFGQLPLERIESIFGFVQQSTLYGGRIFRQRELSDRDVAQLNSAGIGVRLAVSNHFVTREDYEENQEFLARYHYKPNSVIVTNDDLARWIAEDFPDYRIDASVIKNVDTTKKLDKVLETYHEVVLPMTANEDFKFLESIEAKDRITLFANAGCAFTCPSKTCYASVSKINKGDEDAAFLCSSSLKEREQLGMIDFDLKPLVDMGFSSFKLLRAAPGRMTGF